MTIVKDADHVVKDARSTSRRTQAGYDAERDMAFYLGRAFADETRVHVFNDLRLVRGEEVAQIDHLLLHRHGAFIVESKSISGEVVIQADGQFIEKRGRKETGMNSPVAQAERQAKVLRKLLNDHAAELLGRIPILGQKKFGAMPIELYVAVAKKGIIRGSEHAPQVKKADLVCDEIARRVKEHQKGGSLAGLLKSTEDGLWAMSAAEFSKVSNFLCQGHTPLRSAKIAGARREDVPLNDLPSAQRPVRHYLCSKCHSINVFVTYGKFGYYLKCRECDGNTPIDLTIERTGKKGRIRKEGPRFFLVDQDSGAEELIFINPETP